MESNKILVRKIKMPIFYNSWKESIIWLKMIMKIILTNHDFPKTIILMKLIKNLIFYVVMLF